MKKVKQKIWITDAVAQIRRRYPKITPETIRFAAMVFYPIAMVEVVAWEKSIEDFDSVQLMILRFINLGMGRDEIAGLTGLTSAYIEQVQELLYGYGHITPDGAVTDIGKESITKKQKIEYKESKRHVQLDALSLSIIPYEKSVDETTLYDREFAHAYQTGVISYPEGIDAKTLEAQLKGMDYSKIAGAKDIHVNIVSISEMRCLKLRYAIACMLCLEGSGTPIVFGARKGQEKASAKWLPFGVGSEHMRQIYDFGDIGSIGSADMEKHLNAMKARFDEKWEIPLKKEARGARPKSSEREAAKRWNMPLSVQERSNVESQALLNGALDFYPFVQDYCQWRYQGQTGMLFVGSGAFEDTRRISLMARILLGFAMDGVFPLTTEKLCGRVVIVRPMGDDALLQDVIGLLRGALKRSNGYTLDRYLKSSFGDGSEVEAEKGSTLLERLKQVLAAFLEGKPQQQED